MPRDRQRRRWKQTPKLYRRNLPGPERVQVSRQPSSPPTRDTVAKTKVRRTHISAVCSRPRIPHAVTPTASRSRLAPNGPQARDDDGVRVAPEAREHPPAPLVRRLLLHALEPRRHRHFPLPVRLPARQFLAARVQHDERRQAAGPVLPLHAHRAGVGAREVRERLRPEVGVRARAADGVVRAVGGGGGGALARGAEADGGEAAVAFLRVGLAAEKGQPVDGAAFVRVEAQAGEVVEALGALFVFERAEGGVFAAVEPGGRDGQVVADQGGEFEVVVAGPEADLFDLLGREEAVVGVAPGEVGLLADRDAVVADLFGVSVGWRWGSGFRVYAPASSS